MMDLLPQSFHPLLYSLHAVLKGPNSRLTEDFSGLAFHEIRSPQTFRIVFSWLRSIRYRFMNILGAQSLLGPTICPCLKPGDRIL